MSREAIYAPVFQGDEVISGERAIYPPKHCRGGNDCRACPRFRCTACGKLRPWCVGGGDSHPGWCSDCYSQRHRRLKGRFCGARGCDEHVMYRQRIEWQRRAKTKEGWR